MTDEPTTPVPSTPAPPAPGDGTNPADTAAARRRIRLVLIIAGSVFLALLATVGILYAVLAAQRTPQAVVESFLGSLVDGDPTAAAALLAVQPTGNPVLMSDATVPAPADRVTGFRVISATTEGERTTVIVDVDQAGETDTVELPLVLVRRDGGILDVWRIHPDVLPTVYVTYPRPDGMDLTVNGAPFGVLVGAFDVDVPAFPGTYVFEPEGGTDSYDAEPASVTVRFGSDGTAALPVTLTAAGEESARAAVNAHLDACLAQPVLAPSGDCGFWIIDDGATYTNIRWTMLARPTVTFGDYTDRGGWAVLPDAPGSIRFDADYSLPGESGTAEAVFDALELEGVITGFDDAGAATFESVQYR